MNKACVNIGCGNHIKKNWTNLDINPINDSVKKFDIKNLDDLQWLSKNNFDYIECMHIIGYLNLSQIKSFFESCFESLNKNGKLVLEFPDLKKISSIVLEDNFKDLSDKEYIEVMRSLYAYDYEDALDQNFNSQTYVSGWTANYVKFSSK